MISLMLIASKLLAANKVGGVKNGNEFIKKYGKLLKTRKTSKGQKLSKSRNSKGKKSAKSKKLSKCRNSPNFNIKKAGLSLLTSKAMVIFNRL